MISLNEKQEALLGRIYDAGEKGLRPKNPYDVNYSLVEQLGKLGLVCFGCDPQDEKFFVRLTPSGKEWYERQSGRSGIPTF